MNREPFQGKSQKLYKMITGTTMKDTKYLEHNKKYTLKISNQAGVDKTKMRNFDEDMRERYRV
jgi:hypothetical protein